MLYWTETPHYAELIKRIDVLEKENKKKDEALKKIVELFELKAVFEANEK